MGNVRVVLTEGDEHEQHDHEADGWSVDASGTLTLVGVTDDPFASVASYPSGVWHHAERVSAAETAVRLSVEQRNIVAQTFEAVFTDPELGLEPDQLAIVRRITARHLQALLAEAVD